MSTQLAELEQKASQLSAEERARFALSLIESLEPTEYLKLVMRYLTQARELEKLAGPEKILRVETCESALTGVGAHGADVARRVCELG